MRKIFPVVIVVFFVASFIITYFSASAIDYEELLEKAQNRRRELMVARLTADDNATKALALGNKELYLQYGREAEKINKELKGVMDNIALFKKAVANFDEVTDAGQSVANLGYSRKPYKGKIEDLEAQIARNKKDMSDLEARLEISPNDPILKRAFKALKEETFQLKESLIEARDTLKNLNSEMRDKMDPGRLEKIEKEKANFDLSKELQAQLEDAESELKKARLLRNNQEQIKGLELFIKDTKNDIRALQLEGAKYDPTKDISLEVFKDLEDKIAKERDLVKRNKLMKELDALVREQRREERAALSSEAAAKIEEAKDNRTRLFREAISPEQVAKREAAEAAKKAAPAIAKKMGWFRRFVRGRSNVVLGLPLPDPIEVLVVYPIAQRVANQCHEVITSGNNSYSDILGGELTPDNCEKILEEIRRKFGVDPLREKGGALYKPEGFFERWRRESKELEEERERMRIS